MKLLLFDIDGTLVRGAPPVHRQALCDAAREVFGAHLAPAEFGQTAGMTDSAIARRELRSVGVPDAEITAGLAAFSTAAAEAYDRLAPDDLSAYHTPHAVSALVWLRAGGATLGLVTGNIERIAWRKLSAAGLASFFTLDTPGASVSAPRWIGGFGDQAEDRNALPPLALAHAERALGVMPQPRDTWVIGDTPADISCGAAHDLRTVAVATGPIHSLAELRACGPDLALADLGELPAAILED
ncbi:MAG TPA: HAD family hydrolase [Ktedonobacterales bacterium]|nr:HAD family hydrolase [Ktedonobacterales bacterium]HEX5570049.1 HAD family hydrolase [Ktedonobacterales bacterium]